MRRSRSARGTPPGDGVPVAGVRRDPAERRHGGVHVHTGAQNGQLPLVGGSEVGLDVVREVLGVEPGEQVLPLPGFGGEVPQECQGPVAYGAQFGCDRGRGGLSGVVGGPSSAPDRAVGGPSAGPPRPNARASADRVRSPPMASRASRAADGAVGRRASTASSVAGGRRTRIAARNGRGARVAGRSRATASPMGMSAAPCRDRATSSSKRRGQSGAVGGASVRASNSGRRQV